MESKRRSHILNVVVTGASGDTGQALSYRVAKGDVFGLDQRLDLVLVEQHSKIKQLIRGVAVELGMCNLTLVHKISCTHKLDKAFKHADVIFLVAGVTTAFGFSRRDVISMNAIEYKEVGLALERVAKPTVKILMVAEPQNINIAVLRYFAPSLKPCNITGLSRVEHNRAQTMIARLLDIASDKVTHITMWGNRSPSIFPDIRHAQVEVIGKVLPAYDAIQDDFYLKYTFMENLQKREAEIRKKRKAGTYMTTAVAAAQHMRDWVMGIQIGDWTSMVVVSDGSYGVEKGLPFSFPVRVPAPGQLEIVPDLDINHYEREKLDEGADEIKQERMFAYLVLEVPEAKRQQKEEQERESHATAKAQTWSFGHGPTVPCSVLGQLERERLGNS